MRDDRRYAAAKVGWLFGIAVLLAMATWELVEYAVPPPPGLPRWSDDWKPDGYDEDGPPPGLSRWGHD